MSDQTPNPLDRAVSDRLAQLRTMPVDMSGLDRVLEAQIGPSCKRQRSGAWRILRPLTAVAASIGIIALILASFLNGPGEQVMASPAQMAQVHRDIVAHRVAVTKVASIEEAGTALSALWSASPALPAPPEAHVMACCMKSIKDKRMACVLMESAGGTPVTMSVAHAGDMHVPDKPTVVRDGQRYFVHATDGLNMVMTERAGRMVCLISELPQEQLIDLAAHLKF